MLIDERGDACGSDDMERLYRYGKKLGEAKGFTGEVIKLKGK